MRRTALLALPVGLVLGLTPALVQPASAATPYAPRVTGVAVAGGGGLTWVDSIGQIDSYRVYDLSTATPQLLGQVPRPPDGESPVFVDPALAPGGTRTYGVSSVNADGESVTSSPVTLTRAATDPVAGGTDALTVDSTGRAPQVFDTAHGDGLVVERAYAGRAHAFTRMTATQGPTTVSFEIAPVPGPGVYPLDGPTAVPFELISTAGCTPQAGSALTVRQALFSSDLVPLVLDADLRGVCGDGTLMSIGIRWHASSGYLASSMTPLVLNLRTVAGQPRTESVTFRNTGTLDLPFAAPALQGSPDTLSLGSSDCPEQLAPGQSCSIAVTYASGARTTAGLGQPGVDPVPSHRVSIGARTATVPLGPPNMAVATVLHRNLITWQQPYDEGATGITTYQVYRSVDGAPGQLVQQLDRAVKQWIDADVLPGHSYLYGMTASTVAGEGPLNPVIYVVGAHQSVVSVLLTPTGADLAEVPIAGGSAVPLEANGLQHATPAVSPDGLSVVYSMEAAPGAAYDLWVRRLDGVSAPVRLTDTPLVSELDPSWSPDGAIIAFTSQGSATVPPWLARIPATGGSATRIATGLVDPSWLPDGRSLVAYQLKVGANPGDRLVRTTLTGVVTPLAGGAGGYAPSVSPLGDLIAFSHDQLDATGDVTQTDLWLVPVAGGTPNAFANGNNSWSEPSWDPDGTGIVAEYWQGPYQGIARVAVTGRAFGAWNGLSGADLRYVPKLDITPVVGGARAWTSTATTRGGAASVALHVPAGGTGTCSLDGAAYAPCAGTWSRSGLANGSHVLRLRSTGSGRPTSVATTAFAVDSLAPALRVAPVPQVSLTAAQRWTWTASDASGVLGYDVRYRRAARGGGYSGYAIPAGWGNQRAAYRDVAMAPGFEYCLSVRARDTQGNASAWSPDACAAGPVDDRSLSASAGWSRLTGSGYYRGTATAANRTGVTLAVAGVTARRVFLVATTCATCGAVQVVLGGQVIGNVSLRRPGATAYRVVLALPVLPVARSGALVLRTSYAGPVQVDGVALRKS